MLTPCRTLLVLAFLSLAGCSASTSSTNATARGGEARNDAVAPSLSGDSSVYEDDFFTSAIPSVATGDAIAGRALISVEGERTAATVTMLRLPLPDLGAPSDEAVEWSRMEMAIAPGAAAIAVDAERGLALVAGETGVALLGVSDRLELLDELSAGGGVASVSLAGDGTAAVLDADGRTLRVMDASAGGLANASVFPLPIALGSGARASTALLNDHGEIAVLDEGRSRVVLLRVDRSSDGVSLEKLWERPAGGGMIAAAWTGDGGVLAVAQRMLSDELASEVEVVAASGRVSFFEAQSGRVTNAATPGLPTALALSSDGRRAAVVIERSEGEGLALLNERRTLDWARLSERTAGVAFDASDERLLVAMPERGELSLWEIENGVLRDSRLYVETGRGVSTAVVVD